MSLVCLRHVSVSELAIGRDCDVSSFLDDNISPSEQIGRAEQEKGGAMQSHTHTHTHAVISLFQSSVSFNSGRFSNDAHSPSRSLSLPFPPLRNHLMAVDHLVANPLRLPSRVVILSLFENCHPNHH